MTSPRDKVAEAMASADTVDGGYEWDELTTRWRNNYLGMADAAIAALHPVIETVAELNSNEWLMGTVIQEIHTGECCDEKFCDFYPPLWEMAFQCGWTRAGKSYDADDDMPRLPCRVLYHPEVDR